jgi:hypothetical protein
VAGSVGSVSAYDLAQIVDAIGECGAGDGARNVNGGEGTAAEQEGVKSVVLVRVPADDLACVIDALWNGDAVDRGGQRIVEGGVGAAAAWIVEKAVDAAAAVLVPPDDLARIVDGSCLGAARNGNGIVENDGEAAARYKAVVAVVVSERPDDLSAGIDAEGLGVAGQGVGKDGVSTATVEEAIGDGGGQLIMAHDVTRGVDAVGRGAGKGGRGSVEGREDLDWHGAASWNLSE